MTIDEAAARLDAEHARTIARLAALDTDFAGMVAASEDSNADDEHDPEGSTIAYERSQLDTLIRHAQRHLQAVAIARQRLTDGEYDDCEACGKPIGTARLEARPTSRTCIACASRS